MFIYKCQKYVINKREELESILYENSPDIIMITETWIHENILDSEINIQGCTYHRKDRKGKRGGEWGDFNHRNIDWDLLESDSEGEAFLNLTQDFFMTQHVLEPTRGENTLDLVLSTNPDMIKNVNVTEPFGTSDHSIVNFDLP